LFGATAVSIRFGGIFSRLRRIESIDPSDSNAMEDGHEALWRSGGSLKETPFRFDEPLQ
jgi:hypothetical protein